MTPVERAERAMFEATVKERVLTDAAALIMEKAVTELRDEHYHAATAYRRAVSTLKTMADNAHQNFDTARRKHFEMLAQERATAGQTPMLLIDERPAAHE
jgi:hypothetical protein